MKLRILVGSGGRIMSLVLPFLVAGIVSNILWPHVFRLGFGMAGLIAGVALLLVGVPLWLYSVALILIDVPKKRLITRGPFRIVLHPLYTSVALLVLPGLGILLDTWLGAGVGLVLYISSRIFSPEEERILQKIFPKEYPEYRLKVIIPWL